MLASRHWSGVSGGWVGAWEITWRVILFSFIDSRRMVSRSVRRDLASGRALNCSMYKSAAGVVRETVERKCSSSVMSGGKVSLFVILIDGTSVV